MATQSKQNHPADRQWITLPLTEISDLACRALKSHGTPHEIAVQVVDTLIENEVSGHASHGLVRLKEYIQLIKQGHVVPSNHPMMDSRNEWVTAINGQKCFGVLSCQSVSQALTTHLNTHQFGFVLLTNSGHIGRLWSIASPVCEQGGVIIGFSNLAGAGQNVLPYGGKIGRLCTNPLVIGIPSKPPILVDMSTSAISEGKLRKAWLQGSSVPDGWLFDQHWQTVHDPEKFYQTPKTAFLGPLGGKSFGYKGFALALMAEVFAGILTGGGFSQPSSNRINNNGLFLTFHPNFLGQSLQAFRQQVNALVDYLQSASIEDKLHIPGWTIPSQPKSSAKQPALSIEVRLFNTLKRLAK